MLNFNYKVIFIMFSRRGAETAEVFDVRTNNNNLAKAQSTQRYFGVRTNKHMKISATSAPPREKKTN
jgi:hypothetical protein